MCLRESCTRETRTRSLGGGRRPARKRASSDPTGSVKTLALPPRSPNLNAYAERWVRSVKEECLAKLILLGEGSLRRALRHYEAHYHEERNHQGKDNVLLFPLPTPSVRGEQESQNPWHPTSPNHLQGKLNLASRSLCRGDQSRARDGIARLIEDSEVIRRRSKICPVKEIEKLGPELNIRVLRKQSRVIVLENRCVKLRYAGTDECVPPEVASEIRRIRKRQTLSFDVMVGIPGIRQRLTARPDHTIRRLVGFIQLHSQWVAAQQRRKRLASRSSVNSSQLPASKCPLREP